MFKLLLVGAIGTVVGASAVHYEVLDEAVYDVIDEVVAHIQDYRDSTEEPEVDPITDEEVEYLTAGVKRVIKGGEKSGINDALVSLDFDAELDVMTMRVQAHDRMPDEMAHRRTLSYARLLAERPAGSDEFTFDVEVHYEHVDGQFAHDVQYIRADNQYESSETTYLNMWLDQS